LITRGETPLLVVTDRGNSGYKPVYARGQARLTSILGTSKMPCYLHERNGEVVIPDLLSKGRQSRSQNNWSHAWAKAIFK